jgi:hypothetical protein
VEERGVKTKDPIILNANKKKCGTPYTVTVGHHHHLVLTTLQQMPGLSDHEITFLNDVHMLAARRCELRDAGLIEQAGRNGFGMTWRLTEAGEKFLGNLR